MMSCVLFMSIWPGQDIPGKDMRVKKLGFREVDITQGAWRCQVVGVGRGRRGQVPLR